VEEEAVRRRVACASFMVGLLCQTVASLSLVA
jgi:hypothetical protein